MGKKSKPLDWKSGLIKTRDENEYTGSRPISRGNVVRTGKGRKFEPLKAKLEDCEVTYTPDGKRTVHQPHHSKGRMVEFKGKKYFVPHSICG